MDHVHPHLAVHVLDRDALVFAAGGWWTNSTLRTLPGSQWNVSYIPLLSAVLILLYLLTVGPVRGFAFFLGLSTLLDIVVAWFFTRPLVAILGRRRMFTSSRFGVARGLGMAETKPAAAT